MEKRLNLLWLEDANRVLNATGLSVHESLHPLIHTVCLGIICIYCVPEYCVSGDYTVYLNTVCLGTCVPEVVGVVSTGFAVVSWSEVEETQLWLPAQPLNDLQRIHNGLQWRREPRDIQHTNTV